MNLPTQPPPPKTPRKPRAKRAREGGPPFGPILTTPADVFSMLRKHGDAEQESFYAVLVNIRNAIIGEPIEVSRGTLASVEVHPRDVFRTAIRMNAAGIVVAHNHPSGDVTPSSHDYELTKRLRAAGEIIGIPVLDHVVFTASEYRSIAEMQGTAW